MIGLSWCGAFFASYSICMQDRTHMRPSTLLHCLASTTVIAGCALLSGCQHGVSDSTLTTEVHAALTSDPSIRQQPVQAAVQNGVVTLTGNVSDDTASSVAAQDAARVKGVRQVVNSLTVAGMQMPPTVTSPADPTQPRQTTAGEQQTIAQGQSLAPPAAQALPSSATNAPAPLPPAPVIREFTAPAGTSIPIRITERLDSQTATDGEPFNGVVTRDVVADGAVVIAAGSAVSGRVVAAKDAGHYKGHSLLSIELTSVRRRGTVLPLSTAAYTVEGKNRGTNSAEKIGGGAAVGAVLGGIFGHGKGAAIGALAGGGGGAAVQGFTRGQQVAIASETPIRFRLLHSLTVRSSDTPSSSGPTTLHER